MDAKYAIAANVRRLESGYVVELYLFENISLFLEVEKKDEMRQAMELEYRQKKLARRDILSERVQEKRFCLPSQTLDFHSADDLREHYGLNLVKLMTIDQSNTGLAQFTLDLGHLLAETDFALGDDLEDLECLVDLHEELDEYFRDIHRNE